jgi:hypothetical protein
VQSVVQGMIVDRLVATVYPSLVPGGVWPRRIKAGAARDSTPGAFTVDPGDPAQVQYIRESIYVMPGGDFPAPQNAELLGAWESYPQVYYYLPATAQGRAGWSGIDSEVCRQLTPPLWVPAVGANRPLVVTPLEATALVDSAEFDRCLVCYRRLRCEYVRP